MKVTKGMILLLWIISLLTGLYACSGREANRAYEISDAGEISAGYDPGELRSQHCWEIGETLEDLLARAQVTVRAELKQIDNFDYSTSCYVFDVMTDYCGTAGETIYVYDDVSSYYEIGGVYYLLCTWRDSALYPHRIHNRCSSDFLVREYLLNGERVLDFRDGHALGLTPSSDLDALLKGYAASEELEAYEPWNAADLEDAVSAADLIVSVAVTQVKPVNKYVAVARCARGEIFKGGVRASLSSLHVPADTQVGDELLLLLKQQGSSYYGVSYDYGFLELSSPEAGKVLDMIAAAE